MKVTGKRLLQHYGEYVDAGHKWKPKDRKMNNRLVRRRITQINLAVKTMTTDEESKGL